MDWIRRFDNERNAYLELLRHAMQSATVPCTLLFQGRAGK